MSARHWLTATLIVVIYGSVPAKCAELVPGPAYLVYAGPYSSSPSSAFGHLFLAFSSYHGQPPPLWRVVTFGAETHGADPLRYVTVGILGGFPGRFSEVEFHEKSIEYGTLADRDLWIVQLDLEPASRIALEDAVERWSEQVFPYTFFQLNCAYYLQRVLAEVVEDIPPPSGVVSPTGVMRVVQESLVGGEESFRPATSRWVVSRTRDLRPEVSQRLTERPWIELAADTVWQKGLNAAESVVLQEYFGLKAATTDQHLPIEVTIGLASFRTRSASLGSGKEGTNTRVDSVAVPEFHAYSRARLSGIVTSGGEDRLGIELRGAMHDEYDPWGGHRPLSMMELLSIEITSNTSGFEPRLESVVLVSQRSLPVSDWVRDRGSWMLEFQGRRGGVFSNDAFHLELRSGGGWTFGLPFDTYAYGLWTLAALWEDSGGITIAPGIELGALGRVESRWRWGTRWIGEREAFEWSNTFWRMRGYTRLDVSRRTGLVIEAERRPGMWRWTLAMDRYF